MTDGDPQVLARILYYAQEKYFNHVVHVTNVELAKHLHDSVLLFFKGFGTLLLGRIQEGISLLENARKRHADVSLCCLLGLIYAHKRCEKVDSSAVLDLETKLKEIRKTAGSNALYYAGMFLWLMNKNDKAKEYVDKMLKISNGAREGLVLKGWIYVTSDKPHAVKKSIKYLDEGNQDNSDIFGMMGKAKYFMVQQNYSGALEIVSQLVVTFPSFTPALVTKMKLHLALQDWEQSIEESKRILRKEPNDIDGLQYLVVNHLTMTGNQTMALDTLREFIGALEMKEPQRPELHLQKMLVISRLSGKNQDILQEVYEFIRKTGINLLSSDARFSNELGYQLILQGNWKEASVWYRKATELDENTVESLTGIIWCQVLGGKLEEAEQQLEFLKEVQQSIGKSSTLAYLQAVIASRKNKNEQTASALLNEAAELHFSALHGLPLSIEYYEKLNPMFLIEIVKEYLVFCPTQPRLPGQVLSSLLKQATIILNPLVKAAPGMIEPLFLMAQVKYLSGELETAQGTLQRCLELDPTSTDANLLMAQIHLSQGNIKECVHSLEIGVSYNFQLRDSPLYHFIRARALNKGGEYPEAIKVLKMLVNLPQMKGETKKGQGPPLTTSEQVSIYLELAEALRLNGELHEATKIMQDAINDFSGTPEEIRVTVANVDLALSKGEVDLALTMLRNITPNQPYYTEVKEKMAQIYLLIRKDKRLYIGCYCELCENLPSPHTSLLLGDAYMNIQEPEKALEVYEAAQKKNPLDATVARKIGQAYVYTHQYNKAINYYEVALKMSEQDFLCHDLANLLLKLKKFGKAEKVLNQALDHDKADDLPSMMKDVKNLMLLAKVYETTKRGEVVLETLNKAYDIQQRILKRVRVEQPELIPPQKQVAMMICIQFAEFHRAEKEYEKSVKYYTEALSCVPTDNTVILELAQLYLLQGDTDQCEHYCTLLLQDDDTSEVGTMMMANLMFRKEKYEQAISLYRDVLEKTPDNFSVMENLIDLLRRSGKLEEATTFFELAKKKSSRMSLEPGFNYCMGLYSWHMMQPNQALRFFNKARKDSDWGQKALSYMIQICLNPDNEIIGGEMFENQNNMETSGLKEKRESEQHGIRTAEKLLKEFYPHSQEGQNQVEMLQSYCLMATKEKHNVEKALKVFTEMGQNERDNVPAILAMAQAYVILKHTPKARTQLKRLTKVNWSLRDADELEKAWILLADIYCSTGKYDLATEQVRRCLRYNKSCAKAYECLGFIAEKENAYKDAATNYELAWKYSNQANPSVGFKLAFNYLKDKRYTEAIDVCHDVLKTCPDYPKIREEILEKAQVAIKP
ncbi:tetratricopeptide repeat protein 21A [Anolis carolinensis]|uniref:tetratricopeptide repeat protein 21A n=1 Tax=Anolis carolinensis TaxID=28377 RepID=UPI0002039A76|nr:PREDICTED: tetratricopeptide repeat protein 21A [Anolis carolinensis]|eukprot:XP_003221910.1 PREDICTED: tetratricopeptide repeat protein 21A [Anolis carolinensis]